MSVKNKKKSSNSKARRFVGLINKIKNGKYTHKISCDIFIVAWDKFGNKTQNKNSPTRWLDCCRVSAQMKKGCVLMEATKLFSFYCHVFIILQKVWSHKTQIKNNLTRWLSSSPNRKFLLYNSRNFSNHLTHFLHIIVETRFTTQKSNTHGYPKRNASARCVLKSQNLLF